jgi:hypothetical protein
MASGASVVRVTGGDEHQNIDINLVLVQASRIEGTITNPPDADQRVQLTLLSHDPSSSSGNGASTQPDGRFVFGNVAPGRYTIVAQTMPRQPLAPVEAGRPPAAGPARLWGRATVTVQGEPSVAVSMALHSGRTISGVVSFEMERRPDLSRSTMTVRLVPAPGETSFMSDTSGRIEPDGSFTLTGVPAGRYGFRVSGPWTKSAFVNGEDVLDEPFEFDGANDVGGVSIAVTDQMPELSGTVTPGQGLIALDYLVVAVSTEERYWTPASRRATVTRPDADGRYTLRGLPAGSYRVGLVTDLETGSHQDPEFMRAFAASSGEFVTIVDGGKVTRDLRAR